ncbi:uncharacterized protein CTRU02_211141 [Colletotrichum truncatum]|uniref:Uncharacterized protein n=1 Tax=Colletotrichum truncatum TaxID=5467 RepID=A0ACC3YR66_COLTU
MIYEDRQKTLKDWGFNCTCSLCSSSSDIVAASDGRRERIQQILSALDNPVFRSSTTLIGELADEVDVILEKEGLTAQRGDFYDILARVYIDMGDVKLGRKYAEMAAEKLAHFAGYDDERTERARVLLGELGKAGAT